MSTEHGQSTDSTEPHGASSDSTERRKLTQAETRSRDRMRELAKAREAAKRAKRAQRLQAEPEPVEARVAALDRAETTLDPVPLTTEPHGDQVAAEPHPVNLQAAESPSAESPFGPWLPCIVTAVDAPFPGWISFKDYPAGGVQSQPRARFEWLHGPVAWLTVQPEPVPTPGRGPAREADRFDYDQEGDRLPSAFVRLMDTGDVDVHAGKIFRQ